MKIAVNTRVLLNDDLKGYSYFLDEVLKRIIKKYPEHAFIIIADHADVNRFLFGKNVTVVITRQPVRHPLLRKLWHDLKVPAILKKYKADVFVSCDGFCSLTTQVPQCLLLQDLSFLYNSSFIKRSHLFFYKRYMPNFLHKANTIISVSEFLKNDLVLQYKIPGDKIDVVYSAVREIFYPLSESEKEETKRKYSNEKTYFIYAGALHQHKNLMNLLKAFSVFKKRQKSNWKLVLTGSIHRESKPIVESLKTYKYREDIVLTGMVKDDDMAKLIGSAYALIYPTRWDGFGVPVLEAMNSHVPVITSADPAMQEIAGDTALYADPGDYKDIAGKMMLLYKDESLRSSLIEKGKTVAAKYSWDKTTELIWQSILKAYPASDKTLK